MNKTKIIATIGPSSTDKEVIKELMLNGLDVVRLNLSHADYSFCVDIIEKVNELNKELNMNVAIMLDTVGPEIRTLKFINGEAQLHASELVKIVKEEVIGDKNAFSINIPQAIDGVKHNTIIKLDDGKIELKVVDKTTDYLVCEVLNDGIIRDGKSVNMECSKIDIPFINQKDREDVKFANMMNVDFLALSFVSSSDDILEINDILIELENDHISIIAKVENEKAIEELDEIIRVSDGVMVARGDLGVEIPLERIPGIQKLIINKCHLNGKVSIVATELLSSMENTLRPTRAEVSDIANAVIDGVDAVMLSGETTVGQHPVLALQMMEKVIKSAEENIDYIDLLSKAMRTEKQDSTGLIAHSVADCANRLKAKAIVVPTISGYSARKMSRFRPSCPILALSPDINTVKSLALNFGVYARKTDEFNSFDKIIKTSISKAIDFLELEENDKIIITGGYPLKEVKHTNFMKIEEI
ncbi:MAG: pyruvate kinase [Bacilli bacterium]|nr:pyruvate kinase [Bacilli bacterium]MDD4282462.1 pyruvate kinase [Bacilli bacterium]MDD4718941.1 pyruvate kinase [Bacilli bacterium]